MENDKIIKKQIKEQGILPLFYHDSIEVCIAVTNALYQAGIRSIEFTNRGANAFENFKRCEFFIEFIYIYMLFADAFFLQPVCIESTFTVITDHEVF